MRKYGKYEALLQTASALPEQQRKLAEEIYTDLLETALGGSSAVRGAYCEYVAVRSMQAENPWDVATAEELEAVALWERTAREAALSALSRLNIACNDAHFELHVWNSRTS